MSPNGQLSRVVLAPWKIHDSGSVPGRTAEPEKPRADSLRRFGLYCTLALIFLRFSFLSELMTYLTGRETYVLYIFGPPALISFLFAGGFRRSFREAGPKLWLAFVVWMWIGVPFSAWRGGSLTIAIDYVKTEFILLLFTVGLTVTWSECRKAVYTIAAAGAFSVVVGLYFMRSGAERFSMSWSGQIGNSNDFAVHLLLVVPFILFVVLRPGTPKAVRVVLGAAVIVGLFEILRTASRGALIAVVVTVVFLLLRGSAKQRIAIGTTAVVALVALISLLPADTWNRMLSFSNDAGASKEALESSAIREHLLEESITCTLEHPLLGIGVGEFGSYEAARSGGNGHVGWQPSHNSYTQISSECGIPALLLYLAVVVWVFRLLSRIEKRASGPYRQEMATAAYAIRIGLIGFATGTFFNNFGYSFEFLLVSGLIEVMWRAVRHSESSDTGNPPAVAPIPAVPWGPKNAGRDLPRPRPKRVGR